MTCGAPGCESPQHAHGWCAMHAGRMRRTGTLDAPRNRPITQKFWEKVDRRGPDECWPWLGWRQSEGYGRITTRLRPTETGTQLAHRAAYELLVGSIPDGLHLDHLCRNPPCVNPAHLEPVTAAENTRRGLLGALRTHCKRGHAITEENAYWHDGRRHCRPCRAERDRQARRDGRVDTMLALGGAE